MGDTKAKAVAQQGLDVEAQDVDLSESSSPIPGPRTLRNGRTYEQVSTIEDDGTAPIAPKLLQVKPGINRRNSSSSDISGFTSTASAAQRS